MCQIFGNAGEIVYFPSWALFQNQILSSSNMSLCANGNRSLPISSWQLEKHFKAPPSDFFPSLAFFTIHSVQKLMLSIFKESRLSRKWLIPLWPRTVPQPIWICQHLYSTSANGTNKNSECVQRGPRLPYESWVSWTNQKTQSQWKCRNYNGLLSSLQLRKEIKEILRDCWIP